MLSLIKEKFLSPVMHLFYPHLCAGCGSDLLADNDMICYKCINTLPYTHFAKYPDNPVEKIFWGRVDFNVAMSEFYFIKDSIMQNLIHELKYRNNKALGIYLGQMMGKSIKESKRFDEIDAIIPIPLHRNKEKKRGYNQSMLLCSGISQVLQIPVIEKNVIRIKTTETQTKKHRTARWENVKEKFNVKNPDDIAGKHLLLVDDVITTGATIDACTTTILKVPGVKISIAVLAFSSN